MTKRAVVYLDGEERTRRAVESLAEDGYESEVAADLRAFGVALDTDRIDLVLVEGPFSSRCGADVVGHMRRAGIDSPAIVWCTSRTELTAANGSESMRPYLATLSLGSEVYGALVGGASNGAADAIVNEERGNLGDWRLQELLLDCLKRRFTGTVALESSGTEKTIYLDRGVPIYCSSNILSENFGQMLLRKDVITEIEYEWAKKIQLREGVRQGEALVKIGVLNHQDLFDHLRDQIEEKIVNAFGWHDGQYLLTERDDFVHSVTRFDINPLTVVMLGLQRFLPKSAVQEAWASLRQRWAVLQLDDTELAGCLRGALDSDVAERLGDPNLVVDLALDQGWDRAEAVAVMTTLARAGLVSMATERDVLPAAHGVELLAESALAEPPAERLEETREFLALDGAAAEDVKRLSESLWKAYLRLSCADYFTVLGVSQKALPEEVIAARDELLDVYSAQRFGAVLHMAQSLRALEELQSKIRQAADTLSDAQRRETYLETLPATTGQRRQVLTAEDEFTAGMVDLDEGRVGLARTHFERALTMHHAEPLYMLYAGWARFLTATSADERERGKRLMTKAIAVNPVLDEGYVLLACAYQKEGNTDEAIEQVKTALVFNDSNEAAQQLLQRLSA